MEDEQILACPKCGSEQVISRSEQSFMVNTGEYYCESVKCHDFNAKASCLSCDWEGIYADLKESK